MRKIALTVLATLSLLASACAPREPTDGAWRPVNPVTGTPQPGAANPS